MRRTPRTVAAVLASTALAVTITAGCSRSTGSTEAFCDQVRKVPALEAILARFSEADPDVLADRIEKARSAYDDLAKAAPDEISAETKEVVSLVNDILDAVEQHPTDQAKAATQLRAAMDDHPNIADDRAKVTAFAQDQCDVQLDATLTEGESTTTTPTGSTTPGDTTTTIAGAETTTTGG